MGIVQCSQHGVRGIALVCPHVSEAFHKNDPIPNAVSVTADLTLNDGSKMEATLCTECLEVALSDGGGLDRFGEQGLDWFFELKTEPVCSSCLADVKRNQHLPKQEE